MIFIYIFKKMFNCSLRLKFLILRLEYFHYHLLKIKFLCNYVIKETKFKFTFNIS